MPASQFDALVESAWTRLLAELPPELRGPADEVVVEVCDRPTPEQARELGEDLLGLFEGLNLAEDGPEMPWRLPPVIVLFRLNLLEYCHDATELADEIRVTLAHELGHYFGFDEDGIAELGLE
ncbi:MAG: Possibl zinc metallo-peptidase [Deltaproteobacteria bacterium ADurb.Bin510]|nr:MAG: Possibl zinc metallo-peptidase [Deltaproteobacteria bacterium ADurb.Bin510]